MWTPLEAPGVTAGQRAECGHQDFGAVFELFRSDGDSVREREGAQIWCIRRPS